MRRNICLLSVCLIITSIVISCGDDSTGPEPEKGPVVTESGKAVSKTLASEGGSIAATGSDGTVYALEVPAGALFSPVTITMTPVKSIDGLPLSGGLAGAVELKPSGLVFARAGVLRIHTSKTPGTGEQLAGFATNGDLSSRSLSMSATGSGEFAVLVSHFSVAGAGFGTTQDVSQFSVSPSAAIEGFFNQIIAIPTPWEPASKAQAVQLGHDAFQQVVLPTLQNADDDAALLDAVANYDRWRYMLDFIDLDGDVPIENLGGEAVHHVPDGFADDVSHAGEAAADALKLAISENNGVCGQRASLTALANIFFWQSQAARFGVEDIAHGLDIDSVLDGICAQVVFGVSSFPVIMRVGVPYTVYMYLGVRFEGGTTVSASLQVDLTGSNLSIQSPSGRTIDTGSGFSEYSSVMTAPADGEITLSGRACLLLPGTTTPSALCGEFEITSYTDPSSVDLSGTWVINIHYGCTNATGDTVDDAQDVFTLTQNQDAISGSLDLNAGIQCHCLCGVQLTGSLSGTISVNDLGRILLSNFSVELAATDDCPASVFSETLPMSLQGNYFYAPPEGLVSCSGCANGCTQAGMPAYGIMLTRVSNAVSTP